MNIQFNENYGLWWPDFEEAADSGLVRMFKRVNDCDVVASHARTRGIAVQAGGHCGLWARQLAKTFALVHTFEPVPEMFECLKRNTCYVQNILLHPNAIGAEQSMVQIAPRAGGKSKVLGSTSSSDIEQVTIDSLNLPRCDLIYLDIERYELEALAGAKETIAHFRPVLAVEVLDGEEARITKWMDANNYSCVKTIHSDWVFTPS